MRIGDYTQPPPALQTYLSFWRLGEAPRPLPWLKTEWIRSLQPLTGERVGIVTYRSVGVYSLLDGTWSSRKLEGNLLGAAAEPGGTRVLTVVGGGGVRSLQLRDFEQPESVRALGRLEENSAALALSGGFALVLAGGQTWLWSLEEAALRVRLPLDDLRPLSVLARPGGRFLIVTQSGLLIELGPPATQGGD